MISGKRIRLSGEGKWLLRCRENGNEGVIGEQASGGEAATEMKQRQHPGSVCAAAA